MKRRSFLSGLLLSIMIPISEMICPYEIGNVKNEPDDDIGVWVSFILEKGPNGQLGYVEEILDEKAAAEHEKKLKNQPKKELKESIKEMSDYLNGKTWN